MNDKESQHSELTDWRSLMSPKELAAFDAGKYDDVRRAPRESARISRNNREVAFNPAFKEHQPNYDPQLKTYHQQCLEAVDGLAGVAATCEVCGHVFAEGDFKQPRITVLIHTAENENSAKVYCVDCYGKNPQLKSGSLSSMDSKVWNLYEEGFTQAEIAQQLSAEGNPVSQSTVSRLIKGIKTAQSNH